MFTQPRAGDVRLREPAHRFFGRYQSGFSSRSEMGIRTRQKPEGSRSTTNPARWSAPTDSNQRRRLQELGLRSRGEDPWPKFDPAGLITLSSERLVAGAGLANARARFSSLPLALSAEFCSSLFVLVLSVSCGRVFIYCLKLSIEMWSVEKTSKIVQRSNVMCSLMVKTSLRTLEKTGVFQSVTSGFWTVWG